MVLQCILQDFFYLMMEYFKIGKIVASHGLKGDAIIVHNLGDNTSFKNLKKIFVEISKENLLPYFLEKITPKSNKEIVIKIEELNSREEVNAIRGKNVWLEEKDFVKFSSSSAPANFLGFTIYNDEEALGEVIEIVEQPHQLICSIMYKGKEVLVPLHDESLLKVDAKNKRLYMKLPDGLLDIYL